MPIAKPALVRCKTASSANGQGADHGRARLPTSAMRASISLAPSVQRVAKAQPYCPSLIHSPCSFTSMRYRATSPMAHTPFRCSIEPDDIRPASSACPQTSRRSCCLRVRQRPTRNIWQYMRASWLSNRREVLDDSGCLIENSTDHNNQCADPGYLYRRHFRGTTTRLLTRGDRQHMPGVPQSCCP